jgi:hypothetical protein
MADQKLDQEFKLKIDEISSAMETLGGALSQAESSGDQNAVAQITSDILTLEQEAASIQQQRAEMMSQMQQPQQSSQQAARESLATGTYKVYEEKPSTEVSFPYGGVRFQTGAIQSVKKDETEKNLSTQIAQALGVSQDKVDLEEGLPVSDRIALDWFQNPELKAEYIRKNYPDNSEALVVDGEPVFAVRTNDGKVSLSTGSGGSIENALAITGGLASEAIPMAGLIGGAAVGTPAGAGAGSFITGPVAGAIGYTAAGTAQDTFVQWLTGVDQPAVKTFTDRGKEALIALPIDLVTAGSGKFLSRRLGANSLQEAQNATLQSLERLKKQGVEFDVPAGIRFGPAGQETQKILAFQKKGKLLRRMEKTQERLLDYNNALLNGLPNEAGVYQKTIESLKKDHDALVNQIAGDDQQIKNLIQSNLQKRIDALQVEVPNKEPVGNFFKQFLDIAEEEANVAKSEAFGEFYSMANKNKLKVDPDQMADVLLSVRKEMKGKRNPATDAIEQELRQRKFKRREYNVFLKAVKSGEIKGDPAVIRRQLDDLKMQSGPLDYATMNAYIERIAKEVPEGGATGQAIPKQVADMASARLQQFRDGIYKRDNMAGAWANARLKMQDRMAFEGNTPSKMMKTIFGDDVMTPSQVVNTLISDPAKTRQIFDLLSRSSDQRIANQLPALRKQVQDIYLDSIGLSRKPGIGVSQVDFNPEVARVLWGVDRKGNINEYAGNRIVQKLHYLNKAFADAKVPIKDIGPDDINAYFQTLDENSSKSLANAMISKAKAQDDLDRFTNNKVVELALKGKWEFLDGDSLPKALISNTTSYREVGRVLSKMPDEEKQVLANDFMRELLNNYPGGTPMSRAPYATFWDAKRFLKDIDTPKGKSDLVQKMERILGPEKTQEFIDVSRVMDATSISNAPPKDQLRFTAGLGGFSFYLAEGLTSFARNGFYSAMLGSKAADRSGLLKFIARDAGPQKTEEAFRKAVKYTIGTRAGIQALMEQSRNDPRVAAELQKFAATMNQSEIEAQETIDKDQSMQK